MKFNKRIIALLAVFIIVMSACAVSADDVPFPRDDGPEGPGGDGPEGPSDDGPEGPGGDGPEGPSDDGPEGPGGDDVPLPGDDLSDDNATDDNTDDENTTGEGNSSVDTVPIVGQPKPVVEDNTSSSNSSSNSVGLTNLEKNPTGNPVLALMAALAVLGAYKFRKD